MTVAAALGHAPPPTASPPPSAKGIVVEVAAAVPGLNAAQRFSGTPAVVGASVRGGPASVATGQPLGWPFAPALPPSTSTGVRSS